MSDNLEYFFDELRTVAHAPVLAGPADIRRTAARRTTVRRGAVLFAVALVLVAGGLTAYGSGLLGQAPAPTAPPGDVTTTTTAGPATPTPTPSVSSTDLPPRLAGADCRPSDLDVLPYYGAGGAMGTAYYTVLVRNWSTTNCRLYGHPTVVFTDPVTGQRDVMSVRHRDDALPVLLAPDGWAAVSISTVNGNPYGPGAPECAQPRSYQGLSLVIGDDLPYPLPGYALSWECGEASVGPWTASRGPSDPAISEQVVQATMPASKPG